MELSKAPSLPGGGLWRRKERSRMEDILAEAREEFAGDRFAMGTGVRIEEVGDRYAKCSLQLTSRHLNAAGQTMGGAIFTLADFYLRGGGQLPPAPRGDAGKRDPLPHIPEGGNPLRRKPAYQGWETGLLFHRRRNRRAGYSSRLRHLHRLPGRGGKWAGHRAGPKKAESGRLFIK